jgi:tetratricopeptide (TPR) repeat protein
MLAQQPQPEAPPFDPLRAEKNVEVGRFYLKKGNYHAAIERFKEALLYKPNYALPHKLLGEAFEKLRQPEAALTHYERYLEILPAAEDAAKIRKRIARLKQELERKQPPRPK